MPHRCPVGGVHWMAGAVVGKSRDKNLNSIQSSATETTAAIQTKGLIRFFRRACTWLVPASSDGGLLPGSGCRGIAKFTAADSGAGSSASSDWAATVTAGVAGACSTTAGGGVATPGLGLSFGRRASAAACASSIMRLSITTNTATRNGTTTVNAGDCWLTQPMSIGSEMAMSPASQPSMAPPPRFSSGYRFSKTATNTLPNIRNGTLINNPMVRMKMLPWATAASATTLSTLMTKSATMMVPTADQRPRGIFGGL